MYFFRLAPTSYMHYFLNKLIPPRPTFPQDMTEVEGKVMQEHVAYWQDLANRKSRSYSAPSQIPVVYTAQLSLKRTMNPSSKTYAGTTQQLRRKSVLGRSIIQSLIPFCDDNLWQPTAASSRTMQTAPFLSVGKTSGNVYAPVQSRA